jgi:hypothetical protein
MKVIHLKRAFFLFSLVLFSLFSATAQTERADSVSTPVLPSVYLGINSGINHIGGLVGLNIEVQAIKNVSVQFGAGIGGWGTKISGTVRYYKNGFPYGTNFFAGYGRASGGDGAEMTLESEAGTDEKFTMNLKPVSVINLGFGRQWKVGRNMRFGFDLGYSLSLDQEPWTKVSPTNKELSSDAKTAMNFSSPGGLIFGLNFCVGFE